MSLDIHRPYPGVALVVTKHGSVLLGAPADAFKATKKYCTDHALPFPRELVAPQTMLVDAAPQFNPEFFLYDFLFVYGAAFKPDLQDERLKLILDKDQVEESVEALRITLTGPSRDEMAAYRDSQGRSLMARETIDQLARIAEDMAIKKGDHPRVVRDSVETLEFDQHGCVDVLDGNVTVTRMGPVGFEVRHGSQRVHVDLTIQSRVIPFATLPVPVDFQRPLNFGVKPLGTRNGFDLSGPTTGFLFWINGRAVIYDGPVGTRYLLESQGISPEDIDVVILSHCHEDHMGAFVELFLAGYRPKVLTAEPIYRSALHKLAGYFRQPPEDIAKLIDYRSIVPGQPIEELGATFDFFYTVHSIPTIGMRVSMRDRGGRLHQVQISGDTMHHEGIDRMHTDGVIGTDVYEHMRGLVPSTLVQDAYYYADVGESIIHGHPKDWADNPNRVIYYHCPDNDHTRSFGKELAHPGEVRALIEPRTMHPATPAKLLRALRFLDLNDPGWFQSILFRGKERTAKPGDVLVTAGDHGPAHNTFSLIVTGTALVSTEEGEEIAQLQPGEFYGVIELVDPSGRHTATVTAQTPMELFEVDAKIFYEYIERKKLGATLEAIWTKRPWVESAKIFRQLDTAMRNQLARAGKALEFKQGDVILQEHSDEDDFYLLVQGSVDVSRNGQTLATLTSTGDDNYFGEIAALSPGRTRNAQVTAIEETRVLQLAGADLRHLFDAHMGVRYSLMVTVAKRSQGV